MEFQFGIEAEFLLADSHTYSPLWHDSLNFAKLNELLETIPLDGIPSLEALELKAPMRKVLPFVVEGYSVTGEDFSPTDVLPKGLEIRTPVCSSLEECLRVLGVLHSRLAEALRAKNLVLVSLSHHPTATKFTGPQNEARHDHWQWGMEAMTTYGPDINIGLPERVVRTIDFADLEEKINYYGPAIAALTAASPFCELRPWTIRGRTGKSFRMHKRSYIAPAFEFHPQERNRLEFKLYDMPNSTEEFAALTLASLALVLAPGLMGRASRQTRIYDLGQVAREGLAAEFIRERAEEILEYSPPVLREWGFDPKSFDVFARRLGTGLTPADEMLEIYHRESRIEDVIASRSRFRL